MTKNRKLKSAARQVAAAQKIDYSAALTQVRDEFNLSAQTKSFALPFATCDGQIIEHDPWVAPVLRIFGESGAGKTNVAQNLVYGAILRGHDVRITGPLAHHDYDFAAPYAEVADLDGTAKMISDFTYEANRRQQVLRSRGKVMNDPSGGRSVSLPPDENMPWVMLVLDGVGEQGRDVLAAASKGQAIRMCVVLSSQTIIDDQGEPFSTLVMGRRCSPGELQMAIRGTRGVINPPRDLWKGVWDAYGQQPVIVDTMLAQKQQFAKLSKHVQPRVQQEHPRPPVVDSTGLAYGTNEDGSVAYICGSMEIHGPAADTGVLLRNLELSSLSKGGENIRLGDDPFEAVKVLTDISKRVVERHDQKINHLPPILISCSGQFKSTLLDELRESEERARLSEARTEANRRLVAIGAVGPEVGVIIVSRSDEASGGLAVDGRVVRDVTAGGHMLNRSMVWDLPDA